MNAVAFLARGLLAGLIAGIVTFGVAHLVGEPSVGASIAIEQSSAAPAAEADHSHEGETVVSRSNQETWGLATATIVFGAALGGLVGIAAAFAMGRLGRLSAPGTIGTVGFIGFLAVYLVPYLKYPPNPPAVGHAETIGMRTAYYFSFLALSVIAAVSAVVLARRLAARWTAFYAAVCAGLGYLAVMVLAALVTPDFNEVPTTFPAALLWEFRLASVSVQATMWATITVVLAVLVNRLVASTRSAASARPLDSAAA